MAFAAAIQILVLMLLLSPLTVLPQSYSCEKPQSLQKTSATVSSKLININNVSTRFYNDSKSDIGLAGQTGFEFPRGTGKTIMFQSGLLWDAKVNNEVEVGRSVYRSGMTPGRIFKNGSVEYPTSANVRIYRVRPDYKTNDLLTEQSLGEGTVGEIRAQYEKDWNEGQ